MTINDEDNNNDIVQNIDTNSSNHNQTCWKIRGALTFHPCELLLPWDTQEKHQILPQEAFTAIQYSTRHKTWCVWWTVVLSWFKSWVNTKPLRDIQGLLMNIISQMNTRRLGDSRQKIRQLWIIVIILHIFAPSLRPVCAGKMNDDPVKLRQHIATKMSPIKNRQKNKIKISEDDLWYMC